MTLQELLKTNQEYYKRVKNFELTFNCVAKETTTQKSISDTKLSHRVVEFCWNEDSIVSKKIQISEMEKEIRGAKASHDLNKYVEKWWFNKVAYFAKICKDETYKRVYGIDRVKSGYTQIKKEDFVNGEIQTKLIERYGEQIRTLQSLMGCKFEKIVQNPNSNTPSEQWAMFSHPSLNGLKHVQLSKIGDRIRAFQKDGFNIFTAATKANNNLLKQNNDPKNIVSSPKVKEAGAIKPNQIYRPNERPFNKSEIWKTIGCKIRVQDAIELEKIALEHQMTLSAMIRGYLEHVLKNKGGN